MFLLLYTVVFTDPDPSCLGKDLCVWTAVNISFADASEVNLSGRLILQQTFHYQVGSSPVRSGFKFFVRDRKLFVKFASLTTVFITTGDCFRRSTEISKGFQKKNQIR